MYLVSSIDNGRTHFASGINYQGSVNSYNNFITRITKYLGFATDVVVDGKTRCLNNKSYVKFLHTLGLTEASVENLSQFQNLDTIKATLIKNRGMMRSHLSADKTSRLGHKMIHAIYQGDVERAQKLLIKGASANQAFWIGDYDGKVSFERQFKSQLPNSKVPAFRVFYYNPLILAASKQHDYLVKVLKMFGSDDKFVGKTLVFSRDIEGVDTQTNLKLAPRLHVVPNRYGRESAHGLGIHYVRPRENFHGMHHRGHHLESHMGLDVVREQTITFADREDQYQDIVYDTLNERLKFVDRPDLNKTHFWSTKSELGRGRIL